MNNDFEPKRNDESLREMEERESSNKDEYSWDFLDQSPNYVTYAQDREGNIKESIGEKSESKVKASRHLVNYNARRTSSEKNFQNYETPQFIFV